MFRHSPLHIAFVYISNRCIVDECSLLSTFFEQLEYWNNYVVVKDCGTSTFSVSHSITITWQNYINTSSLKQFNPITKRAKIILDLVFSDNCCSFTSTEFPFIPTISNFTVPPKSKTNPNFAISNIENALFLTIYEILLPTN